jgi:hypothetical protein
MNIPYELAVSLYKAGFTLNKATSQALNSLPVGRYEYFGGSETLGTIYEKPSLSELIEACSTRDFILSKHAEDEGEETWRATTDRYQTNDIVEIGEGETPEIAVARLWLALHKP